MPQYCVEAVEADGVRRDRFVEASTPMEAGAMIAAPGVTIRAIRAMAEFIKDGTEASSELRPSSSRGVLRPLTTEQAIQLELEQIREHIAAARVLKVPSQSVFWGVFFAVLLAMIVFATANFAWASWEDRTAGPRNSNGSQRWK